MRGAELLLSSFLKGDIMINVKEYSFYSIDSNYLKYLYSVDREVYYDPKYKIYTKPYVGIITGIKNHKYFIPLTSAKPKHKKWKNVSNEHFLIYEIIKKDILEKENGDSKNYSTKIINFKTNVKSMRLRVGKDAKITLSMPFYSTQKMALAFLESHKNWLENSHKKALANLPKDDEMKFLGQIYKIKFDESVKEPFFEDKFIITPNLKALERFIKARAKELFLELVSHFEPFINRPVSRIVIRDSKTRWGSCNHKKGYINLSLRLIEKPLSAVRYVVLHELTHLLYPHHQSSFYKFIEAIMPDYKEQEQILKS